MVARRPSRGRWAALLLLAVAGALPACQPAGRLGTGRPSAFDDLGRDLTGEACHGQPGRAGQPGLPPPLRIQCGPWEEPSATMSPLELPADMPAVGAERQQALRRIAAQSPAGQEADRLFACTAGQWTRTPKGTPILLATCSERTGGWPHLIGMADAGRHLLQGETVPAALPALLAAFDASAGGATDSGLPASEDDPRATIAQLEGTLGGGRLFDGGDVRAYQDLMELGRLDNSVDNFKGAEAAYRRALDIQRQTLGADAPGIGDTEMHLALELSNQGRFAEAAAMFRAAAPLIERSVDPATRARLTSYQALDAANRGANGEALALAREATVQRRILAGPQQPLAEESPGETVLESTLSQGELAHSLMIEAAVAVKLGNVPAAATALGEALDIIDSLGDLPPGWRPQAMLLKGEVEARQGRLDDGLRTVEVAVAMRRQIFGDTLPTAGALMTLGRVHAMAGHAESVLAAYREAFGILDQGGAAVGRMPVERLLPFLAAAQSVGTADPARRPALAEEMLRAAQRLDRGTAGDTMARSAARLAAGEPATASLMRELQDAERRRDTAQIALANEQMTPDDRRDLRREAELTARRRDAVADTERLERQLMAAFPRYARIVGEAPVDAAELRRQIAPDEALISFAIGKSGSFAFVVRAGGVTAIPLAVTEQEVAAAAADLRDDIEPKGGRLGAFDLSGAYHLYQGLLAPAEASLDGVRHLIVVPRGALASLPFALLVTRPPASHDYSHAAWLVRRWAVTVAPSLRAFAEQRKLASTAPAPRPFLGVAAPHFQGTAAGVDGLTRLSAHCREDAPIPPELLRALPPLPETAAEATQVATTLHAEPGSVMLGDDASEAALRRRPLDQYRILYFATHGFLPAEMRCQAEPALALSPPATPAAGKDEDGLLEASEVASLRLNAELVVLSACNTAASGGWGGEALSGLAEAFFHAGARSVLVSHWRVPSASTVRLMTGAFERLPVTGDTAEALRQSQLALIDDMATAHPYHWAAFSLVGAGGPRGGTP